MAFESYDEHRSLKGGPPKYGHMTSLGRFLNGLVSLREATESATA
jgi:hypothetical protein